MLSAGNAWAHRCRWDQPLGPTGTQQQVMMLLDPSPKSVCGPRVPRAGRAAHPATFSLDGGAPETWLPPTLSLGRRLIPCCAKAFCLVPNMNWPGFNFQLVLLGLNFPATLSGSLATHLFFL